jgi:antitoxin MazE
MSISGGCHSTGRPLPVRKNFGITLVMMTKRLTRVGNSQAIMIDKPIMDLLGITMETELEITTDGRGLHIVPRWTDAERRRRVKAATDQVMAKHKKTFEKLAK